MKLITLNIEHDRHYSRFVPFLKQENADIVCLQEVYKEDLPTLLENIPFEYVFYTPMCIKEKDGKRRTFGHAILTNHPATLLSENYYYTKHTEVEDLPTFTKSNIPESVNRALTVARVTVGDNTYTIGNTHFTWTPDGHVDEWQKKDMEHLLEITAKHPELIMCGDFNIPRGYNEMYDELTKHFTDNIPPEIENSLDPTYHRVPTLRYMVDYIFTTPHFSTSNVTMHCGVSDHCAMVAEVTKNA
jgi:endonuclease/exonuclease/phosphatase family metal-dependent hydrolase